MKRTAIALLAIASFIVAGCARLPDHMVDAAASDRGQSSSETSTSGQSESADVQPTEPQEPLPTMADLANVTLEIPEYCDFTDGPVASRPDTRQVTFVDHVAQSSEPEPRSATIMEVVPMELGDRRGIAVHLRCHSWGNSLYDGIVAYDPNLQFAGHLAGPDPTTATAIGAGTSGGVFMEFYGTDSGVFGKLSGLRLLGDGTCTACHETQASMNIEWTGTDLRVAHVVVHTSNGNMVPPNQEDLQAFYDAVHVRDDATASSLFTANLVELDNTCLGWYDTTQGCPTSQLMRTLHFPKGGVVEPCQFLPPEGDEAIYVNGQRKEIIARGVGQPGDFICGINLSQAEGATHMHDVERYYLWLIVRSPENGTPGIVEFGRRFN